MGYRSPGRWGRCRELSDTCDIISELGHIRGGRIRRAKFVIARLPGTSRGKLVQNAHEVDRDAAIACGITTARGEDLVQTQNKVCRARHFAMSQINWKLIAFWAVLWWFIYSAPTEGWLSEMLVSNSSSATQGDTF